MDSWWTRYLPGLIREWLEGRQQLQRFIGNTGWLLLEKILRIAIGLTIGAWVARYLGPAQFGVLSYVVSFIAFFQVLANLEADAFVIRDIAQNHGEPSAILGTALWLRLAFGTCSWLLAIAFMLLFHPHDLQLITLTAIVGATLVFQASDTVDLWFQSQSQSRRTVWAKSLSFLLSNGVKAALLFVKAPLTAFAGVMCLEAAASALALALAYRRFSTDLRWQPSLGQATRLLKLSWPFMVSGFMITVFMRVDQIMLKEMLGERELGIFAAALPLCQVWLGIPAVLVTSLAPFVARKLLEGEEPYRAAMATIFRYFGVTALLGAALTSLAAPWLIELLYGNQYQATTMVLRVHVFTNIFIFIGMAQHLWMINKNANFVTMFCTFFSAVMGVTLNAILIRHFSIMGAVYTYMLVQAFSVVITPCLLRKDLLDIYLRAFLPGKAALLKQQ